MATAIPTACLARSAIRCRDVETGPTLGVLAVFPSTGATCRRTRWSRKPGDGHRHPYGLSGQVGYPVS